MMVALFVYAYAIGVRSSRAIERRCSEDVAFRVITANQAPDHATIARFRVRHEAAIAELFGEVLALCARSGLVKVGVVAVDGTKIAAAATHHATRSYEQIAQEILEDAARIDAAEDELYGDARGDELPEGLRTSGDRRKVLREAKHRDGRNDSMRWPGKRIRGPAPTDERCVSRDIRRPSGDLPVGMGCRCARRSGVEVAEHRAYARCATLPTARSCLAVLVPR
jgi:Transposase domain (DUF772)